MKEGLATLAKENGVPVIQVPAELVTASASALDPDISPSGADPGAAGRARPGILPARVQQFVRSNVHDPTLGCLGNERVSVLRLDVALTGMR